MKKIFNLIYFLNFICSTTINNKRKYRVDNDFIYNQNNSIDLQIPLDNELLNFVLNDLEKYKNEQKRAKFSDCDFNYEDLSEFFDSFEYQKFTQDKINDNQIEKMNLDILNRSSNLIEQSDISKQADDSFIDAPKQDSILERSDKKSEEGPNPNYNISAVLESSDYLQFNNGSIDEQSNTSTIIMENIDFYNGLIITLKQNILNYITSKIHVTYINRHLNRIKNLEKDFAILSKYKLNRTSFSFIYDPFYDDQIINKLKKLKPEKFSNLNTETSKQVNEFIFKKILFSTKAEFVRKKMNKLSGDHKKILFYYEFFKLYKYAKDIPEILTIGGLFKETNFSIVTLVLHIINLAASSVDKIENIRVFILCAISAIFKNSYSLDFDMFKIQEYYVNCDKKPHNLYFVTLEFGVSKRFRIKCRKNENFYLQKSDKFLVRAAVVTLFFQHMLYMIFLNFSIEKFNKMNDFILQVTESDDCIGCFFNDFLKILND